MTRYDAIKGIPMLELSKIAIRRQDQIIFYFWRINVSQITLKNLKRGIIKIEKRFFIK